MGAVAREPGIPALPCPSPQPDAPQPEALQPDTDMTCPGTIPFESEAIVNCLKREVQLKKVCQKILCRQVVELAARERGIEVTSEEIQAEADQQRYAMRLESAAATIAWLESEMITPEDWEAGIRDRLLARKLAEHLFSHQVERYFAENRLNFDCIYLYRIVVPYEQLAQELFYEIEENEISFFEAAHLYDIDQRRRLQCGYEGKLPRMSLKPELAAIVFGARVGEVIGAIQTDQGYELLLVEEFEQAELTAEVRQQIIDQLFNEWLNSELNYLSASHNHLLT